LREGCCSRVEFIDRSSCGMQISKIIWFFFFLIIIREKRLQVFIGKLPSMIYELLSLTLATKSGYQMCEIPSGSLSGSESNCCPLFHLDGSGGLAGQVILNTTPSTSFTIRVEIFSKKSRSKRKTFAVMKSVVCTVRREITC